MSLKESSKYRIEFEEESQWTEMHGAPILSVNKIIIVTGESHDRKSNQCQKR